MAMVDSAVGGKTGVNHPLGKNMIGAFYQPEAVLADMDTLKSLPDRELVRDAPVWRCCARKLRGGNVFVLACDEGLEWSSLEGTLVYTRVWFFIVMLWCAPELLRTGLSVETHFPHEHASPFWCVKIKVVVLVLRPVLGYISQIQRAI